MQNLEVDSLFRNSLFRNSLFRNSLFHSTLFYSTLFSNAPLSGSLSDLSKQYLRVDVHNHFHHSFVKTGSFPTLR